MLIYWVNEWMMNELCIILLVWHIEVQNNGWLTWIKIKYHRASTASLLSLVKLCKPMDCRPPGSSVHGILQVRILEWVAIPFSRGSFWSRDQSRVSGIAGRFFTLSHRGRLVFCQTYSILYTPQTWHLRWSLTIGCLNASSQLAFNESMDCSQLKSSSSPKIFWFFISIS